MPAEVISVDYDQMRTLRTEFDDACTRMDEVYRKINDQIETLRGGEWQADSATKYYEEMDNDVMLGMSRLVKALSRAAEVTNEILNEIDVAEEEASNMIPNTF